MRSWIGSVACSYNGEEHLIPQHIPFEVFAVAEAQQFHCKFDIKHDSEQKLQEISKHYVIRPSSL